MSLIKSHHTQLETHNVYSNRITMDAIKEIVSFIISRHASLIVDIERKVVSPTLLDQEIIRYLDETRQFQMNRDQVIKEVFDHMFGYGLIQCLIEDEAITDIDISRYNFVLIKKQGYKEVASIQFSDEKEFTEFCKLVVIRNGGVINEHDCHARVSDTKYRLRINVTISPRNISGTSMIIRKHRQTAYKLHDLKQLQMMDDRTYYFLKRLMHSSARLVIVGKGAAGKTTLLSALLEEIPITERFLVCESDSELYPENPNFIVQRVYYHGNKKHQLSGFINDGLTMSLDGYCIGELVGDEVFEFIKAGYTDHRILGTLHAINENEVISRIQTMSDEFKGSHSHRLICNAIDVIIYMKKFKVIKIVEMYYEEKVIMNPLITLNVTQESKGRIEGNYEHHHHFLGRLKDEMKVGNHD